LLIEQPEMEQHLIHIPSTLSSFHDMLDQYMSSFTGEFDTYRTEYILVLLCTHLYYCCSAERNKDVHSIEFPQFEFLLERMCEKNHISSTETSNIISYYLVHKDEEGCSKFDLCLETIQRNFTNGELLTYGV